MDDERKRRITELAKRAHAANQVVLMRAAQNTYGLTDEEREQQAVAYALALAEAVEATALLNAAISVRARAIDWIRPLGQIPWSEWPSEALRAELQREIADATAGRGGANLEGIQRELARRNAAMFPGALQ